MAGRAELISAASLKTRSVWIAVVALLAFYTGVTVCASTQKGLSFDEAEELALGYNIWLHQDFRMEGANGDFVKRWATLPYLFSHPDFPRMDSPNWLHADPYPLGYLFFFQSGNVPRVLLLQGRAMALVLGIATGLLIFFCSREIFGALGGLASLALFVMSPHMLAFGGIVSTEMPTCLTLLGSTWCVWRLLHRVTWGWLGASLAAVALALLSKATALVILPITAVMIAVKLFSGRPLEWRLGRLWIINSRVGQAQIFCGLIALHAVFGWAALWAHYDFRYAASPNPADPRILAWDTTAQDPIDPSVQAFLAWSRRTHFLPEGYLDGITELLGSNESRATFMDGQWKLGGVRTFFLYALWAKTPPALYLLFFLGFAGWWWARRRGRAAAQIDPARSAARFAPSFYAAIPFAVLVVVFILVAIGQDLDIGHRHVLPIYPPMYVLIGGAVGLAWALRMRWLQAAIALLMLWLFVGVFTLYPDYLAYFSPQVGGPAQGYQRLVDSSLDWGMDLPGLKNWLEKNNPGGRDPVYFAYFGTGDRDYYGIKYTALPSFPEWKTSPPYGFYPGLYAISATLFESLYTKTVGPWNKVFETLYENDLKDLLRFAQTEAGSPGRDELLREHPQSYWDEKYRDFEQLRFARLCAWLRHNRIPDDNIGYSILIWRLDQPALDAAQFGPPAELADAPLTKPESDAQK